MKPMEAKTETSLTGSRLPGRGRREMEKEKERRYLARWMLSATWIAREYLSAFTLLIPVSFFLLIPSFPSFFRTFLRRFLLSSLSSPLSPLTRGFVPAPPGGPVARELLLPSLSCTTPICGAESFHANSSENAFFVEQRRRCRTRSPVKTVTRRPTGRRQHHRGYRLFFDPLDLAKG